MAVDECNNMWMVEAFENVDFGGEVVLELFVELRQVDRLDRHISAGFLATEANDQR